MGKDNDKGGRKSTKSKKWDEDGDENEYYDVSDDDDDEEWNMSDKDLAL